ncbi:HpcH/HpaI aldolase/citrate lyase family protein [Algoriphagus sp.]|uniref:HpcH/HpaI aldolase/citrate lyase family protein n=1 Tax=Algoriphagus sp. TaxID=1872435 RepID=UPI003F715224
MKHHQYNTGFKFVHNPIDFNKYTDREVLQYCLGATLYMPGKKDILPAIFNKKLLGLTSMVLDFEDAIAKEDLSLAEENVYNFLESIADAISKGRFSDDDLPLLFLRVRNINQFVSFSEKLSLKHVQILAGFVFPKFSTKNGDLFLSHLKYLNEYFGEILYGMPILESSEIAYKESRAAELEGVMKLMKPYRELIVNVRVGATDISSKFAVRRGIDYSIYDILMVRDCLADILNYLSREGEEYVLSAPVWEYFLADKGMKFQETIDTNIHTSLLRRNLIVDEAIDGLLREVIIDKANGFVGKTIIHPSHLKYVNAIQCVTEEEYEDALQIVSTSGGVIKSSKSNKMNEINPHKNWAKKILLRAKAYGVIENEASYFKLFLKQAD